MRSFFRLAIPLAGFAASGQSPQPVLVPRDLTSPTFGRSVVGDFSGHDLPDIVVLASGLHDGVPRATAVMLPAPSIQNTAVMLHGTEGKSIRDLAVVHRGDPDERRDALLLTTDQGLYRWTWHGPMTRLGGPNWLNATRIEVGDTDGDEIPEAIGRMGDESVGNPQNLRFHSLDPEVPTWFVATGQFVLDHLPIDWTSNEAGPRSEVAVAHADGVRFVKDGAMDTASTVLLPTCVSARLASVQDGSGGRCLVVGRTNAAGQSSLVAITPDGHTWTCPLPYELANLTSVSHGLAGGVIVTYRDQPHAVEFPFHPTAYGSVGFGTGVALDVELGTSVGTADARNVDLDGDGDLDQYGADNTTGCLRVRRTSGGADQLAMNWIEINQFHQVFGFANAPAWADEVEIAYFYMEAVWTTPPGQPLTYLRDVNLLPQAVSRQRFGLQSQFEWPQTWPTGLPGAPELPTGSTLGATVTLMRFVEVENDLVVRRGPFTARIWCPDPTVFDFLTNELPTMLGLAGATNQVYPKLNGGGVGGSIEPPKLPPPDDEDPPDGGGAGTGGDQGG